MLVFDILFEEIQKRIKIPVVYSELNPSNYIEEYDATYFKQNYTSDNTRLMEISFENAQELLHEKTHVNLAEKSPKTYHGFLSIFSGDEVKKLPLYIAGDHRIMFKPSTDASRGSL